jgi:predicted dinucleotide-binding enzyme
LRVAVIGTGAVGLRAARQLHETEGVECVRVVARNPARSEWVARELGPRGERGEWPAAARESDVVVLAVPDLNKARWRALH